MRFKSAMKNMKTLKNILMVGLASLATVISAVAATPELGGYCPVCYIAAGKAVKGTEELSVTHEGKVYYFVSTDAVKAFEAEPEKFLPQYDGYCAYGMSLGKKFESDPTVFSVVDGKIYLNKDESIGKLFKVETEGHIVKADAEWKKIAMEKAEMMEKEKMEKEKAQ